MKTIFMPQIKPGDLVRISYTGRLASDGQIFETTDEDTARKGGVWSTASKYGPKLVVFGKGTMLRGLEESLLSLDSGQGGEFQIPFSKAFGPRFPELVRVMSESEFRKQGVQPSIGLVVMIDRVPASVKSVSSGRVMLDFNHPFAGQDVKYSVQLHDVISEPADKAKALSELFSIPVRIEKSDGKNSVVVSAGKGKDAAKPLVSALNAAFGEWEVKVD